MIFGNTLLCLALAAGALAVPASLEARDSTWECENSKGNFSISQNKAEGNLHAAPVSDGKTGSSYPHWYTNGYAEGGDNSKPKSLKSGLKHPLVKFNISDCDQAPVHHKNGDNKDDHYLLEFPVFENGHNYKYDSKKPKEDPGAARVIYTYPHKTFCGIVAHTNGNQGDLKVCHKH